MKSIPEYFLFFVFLAIAVALCMMLIPQSVQNMPGEAIAGLVSQSEIALNLSHGVAKHGTGAMAADECFQQHGTYEIWSNPTTGRQANICHVPDGKWYIQVIEQIDGKWQEITKFAKDKMTNYEQVAQYLRNCGYIPPQ